MRKTRRSLDQKIQENNEYPVREAMKLALLYGIIGFIWIAFPEELLTQFPNQFHNLRLINVYKGWAYVIVTVVLIYYFAYTRLLLFKKTIYKLDINLKKQKAIEKELHQLAYFDTLTGLPNRFMFEEKCNSLINGGDKLTFALISMDVDNFKSINDTLGHFAGDKLLTHIATILTEKMDTALFAARLSGDEFAIIMEGVSTEDEVTIRVKQLLDHFRQPWNYENQEYYISISVGIAMYPEQGEDLSSLLRYSDIAMYSVKKNAKDGYCFYTEALMEKSIKQVTIANELHKALNNNEFTLYYQPIVDLDTGKLNGVEALIRWIHPEKGIISPAEFIPIAEEIGIIHQIGSWVMKTALYQKREWEDMGFPRLKMSINVSGKSLIQSGFVDEIRELLRKTNLKADEIQLEITETVLIEKMAVSKKVLEEISEMGIKIALDDFGTGYSSLTYLKNLPIDVVKLDANFVKGIMENGEDSVIVESVIKLTHNLELKMVAEGVETKEQLSLLKMNECDYAQGYFFSRPVTWKIIEEMMAAS